MLGLHPRVNCDNNMNQLQLTFIPAEYWNKSSDFFYLVDKNGKKSEKKPPIPKDAGFFFMWLSEDNENVGDLEEKIANLFPSIPVKKLLSCKARLCFPFEESNGYFEDKVKVDFILGKIIPLPPMIPLLFSLKLVPGERRFQRGLFYSNSIKTWVYLTKFTVELLSRGCFIPDLVEYDEREKQEIIQNSQMMFSRIYNIYSATWKTTLRSLDDWNRFNLILQNSPWISYNLPINLKKVEKEEVYYSDGVWNSSYLFIGYMDVIADFIIRSSLGKGFQKKIRDLYKISSESEFENAKQMDTLPWEFRFLEALVGKSKSFEITKFSETPISSLIEMWTRNIQGFPFQLGVMFSFKLEYPENPDDDWKLGYFIQPLQEFNRLINLGDFWNCDVDQRKELENVCEDIDLLEEEIFRALGTAAKYFPPISRSLEGMHPQEIYLNTAEVMEFLKHSMFLLIQAGYNVVNRE